MCIRYIIVPIESKRVLFFCTANWCPFASAAGKSNGKQRSAANMRGAKSCLALSRLTNEKLHVYLSTIRIVPALRVISTSICVPTPAGSNLPGDRAREL